MIIVLGLSEIVSGFTQADIVKDVFSLIIAG